MRKLLVSSRLKSLAVLTALSRDRFQTTRLRDLFTETPLPLQIVVRVPKMVPRVKHSWSHLRPPSHPLVLPPELLVQVLSEFTKPIPSSVPPSTRARNNGTLFTAALVSKDWSAAVGAVLYADIHLSWRASVVPKFLQTFVDHPTLHLRVRSVVVSYTTLDEWSDEWHDLEEGRTAQSRAEKEWSPIRLGVDSDGESEYEVPAG